jgi:HEAT repeat protein
MNNNGRHEFENTPEGRVAYLEALLEAGLFDPGMDYAAVFIEHLDHEDARVRATAIRGLWNAPDPRLVDRLIEMAKKDPSPEVRATAVGALGIYVYEGEMAAYDVDFGPMTELLREDEIEEADFERVKAFLLAVYADEGRSLEERCSAVEALGFASDPPVVDVIAEAYRRPEQKMKISALFAMGRNGSERWTEILARELHNAERDIQCEAIRAVGAIGLSALGKDLWRLTYADDKEVMLEAIDALGQTGWEGAFERLEELTADDDPETAEVAEQALDEWLLMNDLLSDQDGLDEDWDGLS